MTKFSVVVPVYEGASKIMPLVNSLNNQTFSNFEVIFVDDCSSDFKKLQYILKKNMHRTYKLMQLENHINGAAARNKGIKEAQGEYIAFADADDYWLNNKLEIIDEFLQKNPNSKFIYHQMICKKEDGGEFPYPKRGILKQENLLEYLFCNNGLIQTTSIVCKKSVLINSLFDENLQRHQDWDFCLNLYKTGVGFDYIDMPLAVWNIRASFGKNKRDYSSLSFSWLAKQK